MWETMLGLLGSIPGIFQSIPEVIPGGNITLGVVGVVLAYLQKRADNKKLKSGIGKPFHWFANKTESVFYGIGVMITVFFGAKFKWTKGLWNKLIEPYFIDFIDNIFNGIIDGVEEIINAIRNGFIKGLKSDNK